MGEITETPMDRIEENRSYWDTFYRQVSIDQESTFCKVAKSLISEHALIIDVGCGSGRDSFAFAAASYPVIGIDRSEQAIRQNRAKKQEVAADQEKLDFQVIDFSDEQQLARFLGEMRSISASNGRPVVYYLRFLLHAIDEQTQDVLLQTMFAHTMPGDIWALEFRTLEDATRQKIYDNHYRRFIDPEAMKGRWAGDGAFEYLLEQSGTGLSVYQQEDPHLCRLILKKT